MNEIIIYEQDKCDPIKKIIVIYAQTKFKPLIPILQKVQEAIVNASGIINDLAKSFLKINRTIKKATKKKTKKPDNQKEKIRCYHLKHNTNRFKRKLF